MKSNFCPPPVCTKHFIIFFTISRIKYHKKGADGTEFLTSCDRWDEIAAKGLYTLLNVWAKQVSLIPKSTHASSRSRKTTLRDYDFISWPFKSMSIWWYFKAEGAYSINWISRGRNESIFTYYSTNIRRSICQNIASKDKQWAKLFE